MAKDPAFLFYPNDWLGGTIGMSFEAQGAYLNLLILQFNKGEFTEAQASKFVGANIWTELKEKFATSEGKFFNSRLKEEYDKRKNFSKSRRNNAQSVKAYAEHMGDHMENENENRNIIVITDESLIELYGEKMLSEFCRYWNEPNKKGKCRWELEKTWSLKSRLSTWFSRSIQFNPKQNNALQNIEEQAKLAENL